MTFDHESLDAISLWGRVALAARSAQRVLPLAFGKPGLARQLDGALRAMQNLASGQVSYLDSDLRSEALEIARTTPELEPIAMAVSAALESAGYLNIARHMPAGAGASGAAMRYGGESK